MKNISEDSGGASSAAVSVFQQITEFSKNYILHFVYKVFKHT